MLCCPCEDCRFLSTPRTVVGGHVDFSPASHSNVFHLLVEKRSFPQSYRNACVCICVCLCLCTPPLETRPFPCHPNRLLRQEALGNYRDAACSNGVPPQPIIWRDSPCQGATMEGGGVVLRRKERLQSIGSLSLNLSPSHSQVPYRVTERGGWGGRAGPGFVPRVGIRLVHASDKW